MSRKCFIYRPIELKIMHMTILIDGGAKRLYQRFDNGQIRRLKNVNKTKQYLFITLNDGTNILIFDRDTWMVKNVEGKIIGRSKNIEKGVNANDKRNMYCNTIKGTSKMANETEKDNIRPDSAS